MSAILISDEVGSESIPKDRAMPLVSTVLRMANARRDPEHGILRHYLRLVSLCLLPWTFVSLIGFAQDLSRRLYWDDPTPLQDAWFWWVRILLWAAMTPLILWLGHRWPVDRARHVALHFMFAIGFALSRAGIELAIQYNLNKWGYIGPLEWLADLGNAIANAMIFGLHGVFFVYWVVLSIQAMLRYYERFRDREQEAIRLRLRASELRAQVVRAQLGALKMQLQPHFLFNTLNAIVILVRQQKLEQAEEGLTRFSDLLRAVLDDLEVQEVPLSKELDYLRLYLDIEQMRFADRLKVNIAADPDLLDACVPHMGVQPIVENAVRHGISCQRAGGTIDIQAKRLDDALHIIVTDNGPGIALQSDCAGHGMGLSNLRARLQQLYGEHAMLRIEKNETRGAKVTLVLPLRRYIASNEQQPYAEVAL